MSPSGNFHPASALLGAINWPANTGLFRPAGARRENPTCAVGILSIIRDTGQAQATKESPRPIWSRALRGSAPADYRRGNARIGGRWTPSGMLRRSSRTPRSTGAPGRRRSDGRSCPRSGELGPRMLDRPFDAGMLVVPPRSAGIEPGMRRCHSMEAAHLEDASAQHDRVTGRAWGRAEPPAIVRLDVSACAIV
jgi:hypothetical protein